MNENSQSHQERLTLSEFNQHLLNKIFKDKRALLIIPHQDDEIIIAGSMILNMNRNQCEVFLVFTTNGDYEIDGKIRLGETLNAMKKLGIGEDHILYLGYSNQNPQEDTHLYFHIDKPWTSIHGKTETNGFDSHIDFRYSMDGTHSKFTKPAFIQDIKDAIIHIKPDFLFVIDFDYHPDHRCASLSFEKAMGEILAMTPNYFPYVYKAFAYPTSYLSYMDYSPYNLSSTFYKKEAFSNFPLSNPAYSWSDRSRFPVPGLARTELLKNNQIYSALREYKSQHAASHAESILNSDQVFWQRRTDSITYRCTIEASSGKSEYLNDYLLFDCNSIMHGETEYPVFCNCSWIPDKTDFRKSVRFTLAEPKDLGEIVFYEGCDEKDRIEKMKILFSNGFEVDIKEIQHNGQPTKIFVENCEDVEWIEFKIIQASGSRAGISEIEIYEKKKEEIEFIKIMVNGSFAYSYFTSKPLIPFEIYVHEKFNRCHSLPDDRFEFFTLNEKGEKIIFCQKQVELIKHSKITIYAQLKTNPSIFDGIEITRLNPIQIFHLLAYHQWIKIKIIIRKIIYILKKMVLNISSRVVKSYE